MPDFVATYTGDLANAAATSQANEGILWSTCRRSTIDPGAVEGTQRVDNGAAAEIHKIYIDASGSGPAEVEVGSLLHGNIETLATDGGELKNFKIHQHAADPTPGAGNIGLFRHRTDTRQVRLVKDASTMATLVKADDGAYITKELPLESWTLGGTAPAAATKGTTPAAPGLRFTSTSQKISRVVRVPAGFSGTADCKLRLYFALNAVESSGDDINVTCDMVSVTKTTSEVLGQASTQYTGTVDIGTATADGAIHVVDITLTYNDANNPIAAGDFIAVEISLTNLTSVADVLFLGGELLCPFGTGLTE
jgi:hypothetical protein